MSAEYRVSPGLRVHLDGRNYYEGQTVPFEEVAEAWLKRGWIEPAPAPAKTPAKTIRAGKTA